jgi:glycosyltransferase involved in cell wall biosynthesis
VSERFLVMHVTTVPMSLTFLRGQVAFMAERGIDIAVVSSPGPELAAFGRDEGVPVHAVSMRRRITPLRDLMSVFRMYRLIRRLRPAIVHAHTPKGGLLGMIAARLARAPGRVYHMRGLPLTGSRGARRRLLRWTEWLSCRLAHRVLCVSHSLRAVAVQERLVDPLRITVPLRGSGQGVDARVRFNPDTWPRNTRSDTRQRLGIPLDALVAGFVGRVVRDKGLVELVGAWRALQREFPELRLLVVGPFEPNDPLPRDVMRTLTTDPRVHLAGEDWDTPPLYAAMDVVVLPTYREGFPNVPLEAGAMRLPVVATHVPGCVDAVEDGVTGILVPPHDEHELTGALRTYLRDPALRGGHGAAARARVLQDFSREAIWAAIHSEYLQLLGATDARAPVEAPPAGQAMRGLPNGAGGSGW